MILSVAGINHAADQGRTAGRHGCRSLGAGNAMVCLQTPQGRPGWGVKQ